MANPHIACRMYEARFPEAAMVVMVSVKHITEVSVYVSLCEYKNVEGMILLSEVDCHRICLVSSVVKVGQQFAVAVLRVDSPIAVCADRSKLLLHFQTRRKGMLTCRKRKVSREDAHVCEERYNKLKLVHSIMRHVVETLLINLEDLYTSIGLPLYRTYRHAYDAFELIANDPDSILNSLTRDVKEVGQDGEKCMKTVPLVSQEVKNLLVKQIRHKLVPQPVKICPTVEIKCYQFDGVFHIQV